LLDIHQRDVAGKLLNITAQRYCISAKLSTETAGSFLFSVTLDKQYQTVTIEPTQKGASDNFSAEYTDVSDKKIGASENLMGGHYAQKCCSLLTKEGIESNRRLIFESWFLGECFQSFNDLLK